MANYLNSLILLSENKHDEAYSAISLADTYGIDMPSVSLTKGLLEFNSQNYESALSSQTTNWQIPCLLLPKSNWALPTMH